MYSDALLLLALPVMLGLLAYLIHQVRSARAVINELRSEMPHLLRKEAAGLLAQLEDLASLRDRLDLRKGLPYTKDWSAAPDFLRIIAEHCLEARPGTIVECSSGLTTLVLARCCQINGHGRVFSLENGARFAEKSEAELRRYGLGDHAEVLHAPLQPHVVDGHQYSWYATEDLLPQSIEMLVIDGPPGFLQQHARYPALPLLFERLTEGCTVFLDDAARADEVEIVELWQRRFPELEHEFVNTERGCSILTVRKSGSRADHT